MIILLFTFVFLIFLTRVYWKKIKKYYGKILNNKISNDIKIQIILSVLYPITILSILFLENFIFSNTFFYLSLIIIAILLITQINNYKRLIYFKTLRKSQHSFYMPILSNSLSNFNRKSNQSIVINLINENIKEFKHIYNNLLDENYIEEIEFDVFINNLRNNELKLLFTCAELHYFIKKVNIELQTNIPYSISNLFLNKKGKKFNYKSVTNNSDKLNNESKNRIDKIFIYEI